MLVVRRATRRALAVALPSVLVTPPEQEATSRLVVVAAPEVVLVAPSVLEVAQELLVPVAQLQWVQLRLVAVAPVVQSRFPAAILLVASQVRCRSSLAPHLVVPVVLCRLLWALGAAELQAVCPSRLVLVRLAQSLGAC